MILLVNKSSLSVAEPEMDVHSTLPLAGLGYPE